MANQKQIEQAVTDHLVQVLTENPNYPVRLLHHTAFSFMVGKGVSVEMARKVANKVRKQSKQ
jgi:hypothetical protein